jgi:hypothetical protein
VVVVVVAIPVAALAGHHGTVRVFLGRQLRVLLLLQVTLGAKAMTTKQLRGVVETSATATKATRCMALILVALVTIPASVSAQ